MGFVAVILRPSLGALTSPINNTLLVGAALLHIEGLLRFKRMPQARGRWGWWAPVMLLVMVTSIAYANDARMRYGVLDPVVTVVLLATAALLLKRTAGRWRLLYGVCAGFVALAGLSLLLRAVLSWQAPAGTPMQEHPVMGLVFLLLLTHNLAWICGMSLAVNLSVQERLQQLALNDPLTGLANRRQLDSFAAQALRRAQRRGEHMAVVVLDLDGFKGLNDRHGHAAGDGVLREVAQRARQATRDTDLVARLGGDEFVVLLEADSEDAVLAAVARLRSALDASPLFDGPPTPVGVSMGVACYPADGDNLVALLREADGRMYGQKRERASTRSMDSVQEPG
jgi:diguanylate cyclase (GGDEF)-like protein